MTAIVAINTAYIEAKGKTFPRQPLARPTPPAARRTHHREPGVHAPDGGRGDRASGRATNRAVDARTRGSLAGVSRQLTTQGRLPRRRTPSSPRDIWGALYKRSSVTT